MSNINCSFAPWLYHTNPSFFKPLHAYIGAEVDCLNDEHAKGDDPKEYEVAFVHKLVNIEVEIFKKIYR